MALRRSSTRSGRWFFAQLPPQAYDVRTSLESKVIPNVGDHSSAGNLVIAQSVAPAQSAAMAYVAAVPQSLLLNTDGVIQ
jgi:hypothetical protein